MNMPRMEPREPEQPTPCVCGALYGDLITCHVCEHPLCEQCQRECCQECHRAVCPDHLRRVTAGGRNRLMCSDCWEVAIEEGEACDCDGRECDVCREQARRRERRAMERVIRSEVDAEFRYAEGMVEVLSE